MLKKIRYNVEKLYDEIIKAIENCGALKKNSMGGANSTLASKFETEIISKIDKHPEVLTIQDAQGRNIGIVACDNKLERVACRALEDNVAATQQTVDGYNIGMVAAYNKLESVVIKALQNPEARIQTDNCFGETILDRAKRYGIDISTAGIFEVEKPSKQNKNEQDELDETISNIYDDIFGN